MLKFDCNNHVSSFNEKDALEDESYPLKKDALNIPDGMYTFEYDYPLSQVAFFTHKITPQTNIIELLLLARKDYEDIYAEEDLSVGQKTGNIPGMLNRARSNGPYGIWGHDISDLYFEGVTVDPVKKLVTFSMGS